MDLCRSIVGPVCGRVCFGVLCVRMLELLRYHWGASGEEEEGCGRKRKRRKRRGGILDGWQAVIMQVPMCEDVRVSTRSYPKPQLKETYIYRTGSDCLVLAGLCTAYLDHDDIGCQVGAGLVLSGAIIATIAALDAHYRLSESRDYEVKVAFLQLAISSGCKEYFGEVERTLKQVGRMKYLRPLYTALVQGSAEETKMSARRIFAEARDTYHPIAQGVVESILAKHS
ncbi:hypothetical protein GW17_00022700 [Ensete ventricosum]|nr:hypothetical protein GW17_00022700 [Ensete ventricosum]